MSKEPLSRQRSWRRLSLAALGLLIVGLLAFGLSRAIRISKRHVCQENLSAFEYAIRMYSIEENGFPSNPIDLIPTHVPNIQSLRLLMCPAVHHQKKDVSDGTDWGDYTYVNWSDYYEDPEKVPADYPLMYDRALSNHDGRGINIARVDGMTFWDPGGAWLRDFAARHPEYDIPVPE